jgi:hypothetical protein
MVAGKRSGELRPPARKKRKGDQPDPEQQMDGGQVPAEAQAEHVDPPKPNLTPEQYFIVLTQQPLPELKRWDADIDEAVSRVKTLKSGRSTFLKTVKAEYGIDAPADLRKMIAMEDPEKEAEIRADVERTLKIAKFMAAPLGTQIDWLDVDRTPDVDRAHNEGLADGRQNKLPNYNKWAQGTAQREFYERGFETGCQERNVVQAQGYKPLEPAPIGDQPATHVDAEEWPAEGQPPKSQTEVASEPA